MLNGDGPNRSDPVGRGRDGKDAGSLLRGQSQDETAFSADPGPVGGGGGAGGGELSNLPSLQHSGETFRRHRTELKQAPPVLTEHIGELLLS